MVNSKKQYNKILNMREANHIKYKIKFTKIIILFINKVMIIKKISIRMTILDIEANLIILFKRKMVKKNKIISFDLRMLSNF